MGLLDYYRQFDDMDESEANARLREQRAQEKALAMERVPVLDLSATAWPELPDAEVVSASVYQSRGRLNSYPDPEARAIRRALAERHNVRGGQIVFGNGSSELIRSAALRLLTDGMEAIVPAPSSGRLELITRRAGGEPVRVSAGDDGRLDPESIVAAVTERTRIVFLCNPNDPTATYLESAAVGDLLSRLPDRVHLLLDESFIHFQDVEEEDACLRLVEAFPHLIVLRSFSCAYGLSGLRAGYAVGSPAALDLLAGLAPELGVNVLTQATVLQALRTGARDVRRRRKAVLAERPRIAAGIAELPVEATDSQANFVWLRAPAIGGDELAARLERARVRVAPGSDLGDEHCVRAAVRDAHATDRLVAALRDALSSSAARAGVMEAGQ